MKLYMHPVSTTSRPVMQFIADNNINVDNLHVDVDVVVGDELHHRAGCGRNWMHVKLHA